MFMVAGLAGNSISFLRYGRFVDYLPFGPYMTNPADIAITIGGILVVWRLLFGGDTLDQGV
jgi:lipoprotein signal peptidase